MEKHQAIAISIFLAIIVFDGSSGDSTDKYLSLFIFLLPILFYRLIAYFSGFGFPEFFASDHGSKNDPAPYAFFFWILFIIACLFTIFDWQIY